MYEEGMDVSEEIEDAFAGGSFSGDPNSPTSAKTVKNLKDDIHPGKNSLALYSKDPDINSSSDYGVCLKHTGSVQIHLEIVG